MGDNGLLKLIENSPQLNRAISNELLFLMKEVLHYDIRKEYIEDFNRNGIPRHFAKPQEHRGFQDLEKTMEEYRVLMENVRNSTPPFDWITDEHECGSTTLKEYAPVWLAGLKEIQEKQKLFFEINSNWYVNQSWFNLLSKANEFHHCVIYEYVSHLVRKYSQ